VKCAALLELGWSLGGYEPWTCAVNRFSIDAQPLSHGKQALFRRLRNCAVWLWPYIQKKKSILADAIHQPGHQLIHRLKSDTFHVSPRASTVDRGVGNPLVVSHVAFAAQFQVINADARD